MKRIAIILDKRLEIGAAANVAALLMGQAARNDATLYSESSVLDLNGVQHAGIKYSTVLLKAGENQLLNLASSFPIEDSDLQSVVFTQTGQQLNNAFDQYAAEITSKTTEGTKIVGVIVWGGDEDVRKLTKKYSVL